MTYTNTRSVVEAGIMAAIAIIFALAGAYIPLLGPFIFFLWPVPIILLGVRHGFKWSIMATAVAGMLVAILIQPIAAVNVVVGFSLIGIVLGHAYRARWGAFQTLLWASAAMVVSVVAVLLLSMWIMGVNPLELQMSAMENALGPAIEMYRQMGVPEDKLAETEQNMVQMMKLLRFMVPFSIISASVFMAYLNMAISRVVLRKLGNQVPSFPPFKSWSLPLWFLYLFVLVTAMLYFTQSRGPEDPWLKASANLFYAGMVLMLIQGLALFYYLADKYNLSRLMRNIILVLIISNGLLATVAIFAGTFDLAVDYRQLRSPRSP